MRIIIFNRIIRTSKSLRKILEEHKDKYRNNLIDQNFLLGVYSCRIFGICIYRTEELNKKTKNKLL